MNYWLASSCAEHRNAKSKMHPRSSRRVCSLQVKKSIKSIRGNVSEKLWEITKNFDVLARENWTSKALEELKVTLPLIECFRYLFLASVDKILFLVYRMRFIRRFFVHEQCAFVRRASRRVSLRKWRWRDGMAVRKRVIYNGHSPALCSIPSS